MNESEIVEAYANVKDLMKEYQQQQDVIIKEPGEDVEEDEDEDEDGDADDDDDEEEDF